MNNRKVDFNSLLQILISESNIVRNIQAIGSEILNLTQPMKDPKRIIWSACKAKTQGTVSSTRTPVSSSTNQTSQLNNACQINGRNNYNNRNVQQNRERKISSTFKGNTEETVLLLHLPIL